MPFLAEPTAVCVHLYLRFWQRLCWVPPCGGYMCLLHSSIAQSLCCSRPSLTVQRPIAARDDWERGLQQSLIGSCSESRLNPGKSGKGRTNREPGSSVQYRRGRGVDAFAQSPDPGLHKPAYTRLRTEAALSRTLVAPRPRDKYLSGAGIAQRHDHHPAPARREPA